MKTIDEIRAEIKATHERQMEELRALDAELDAIKAKMEGEQQWPKDGDGYWFIVGDGDISDCQFREDGIDLKRISIGNCFRTKAEAEKHRDWLKAVAEIRRMIGDKTGIFMPMITKEIPSYTFANCNPFGCDSSELATKVASSPAFKTFLGVE